MTKITPKLVYSKENTANRKGKILPTCRYCSKEISGDFFVVITINLDIQSIFRIVCRGRGRSRMINLCPECFNKLHDLMEECESEGFEILEDEFPDDDLSNENGTLNLVN